MYSLYDDMIVHKPQKFILLSSVLHKYVFVFLLLVNFNHNHKHCTFAQSTVLQGGIQFIICLLRKPTDDRKGAEYLTPFLLNIIVIIPF